jgi:hypothetical protein
MSFWWCFFSMGCFFLLLAVLFIIFFPAIEAIQVEAEVSVPGNDDEDEFVRGHAEPLTICALVGDARFLMAALTNTVCEI